MSPRGLGSICCNELIFPVQRVYLDKGAFVVEAELDGPLPAGRAERYTVHDRTGALVYRSGLHVGSDALTWDEAGVGFIVTVTAHMKIDNRQSKAMVGEL